MALKKSDGKGIATLLVSASTATFWAANALAMAKPWFPNWRGSCRQPTGAAAAAAATRVGVKARMSQKHQQLECIASWRDENPKGDAPSI